MSTEVHVPENPDAVISEAPAPPQSGANFTGKLVPSARDAIRAAAAKAVADAEVTKASEPTKLSAPTEARETDDEPAEPPEPPAEELKGLPKIAATLRAREQAQKIREGARAEHDKMLSDVQRERSEIGRLKAEAEQMRAEAAAERERIARIKTNPMAAIKELGWKPEDLVNGVLREGTPEAQFAASLDQINQQIRDMREQHAERDKVAAAEKQRAAIREQQAHREQIVHKFLGLVPEGAALRQLYDDADIVEKGDKIADAFREKSGGQVATLADIVEALEYEAKKRLERLQPGNASAGKTAPKAGKAGSSGQRTLSSTTSSERRAAPKPFSELKTAAEQRKALEEAAREAVRGS